MEIPGADGVSKDPSVFIAGGLDRISKDMFMFAFAEPSAFRISRTALLCPGSFRNLLRQILRTSAGWRRILILVIFIF